MPVNEMGWARIIEIGLIGLRSLAEQSVIRLQDKLSTPYPPSSEKFQDPHMRTGNLRAGIHSTEPIREGNRASVTIISSRAPASDSDREDVPVVLEIAMDRHYMRREKTQLANGIGLPIIANAMRQRGTSL